jgi:hypothetical protein
LRPKKDGAVASFYTLVTHDTKDQDFSTNRQLFLTEQGYRYNIVDATTILPDLPARLAQMQAEFEEKKLSSDFNIEELAQKRTGKARSSDAGTAEGKPKGRKRKAADDAGTDPPTEIVLAEDVAAGAEDQQPAARRRGRPPKQGSGRDHLRVIK